MVEKLNPTKFVVLLERLPGGGLSACAWYGLESGPAVRTRDVDGLCAPKREVERKSERRGSPGFVFGMSWTPNGARAMVISDGRPRSPNSAEPCQISTPRMYAPDRPVRRVKVSRTVRYRPSSAKGNSLDAVPFRMDHDWMWVKWFISWRSRGYRAIVLPGVSRTTFALRKSPLVPKVHSQRLTSILMIPKDAGAPEMSTVHTSGPLVL